MGCGASTQTNTLNKGQVKKINLVKKDDKDTKKTAQNPISQPKKSIQQSKNFSSTKSLSKPSIKVAEKTNSNLHSSTKSLPKQEKQKTIMKTTGDSLRSSQKDLHMNPSKIKLEVKQIASQNQQDAENYTTEKKLKKTKTKKKTGIDPRLGELLKVYGL